MSEKRGLAMYGDEIKGIPPNKLFDRDDALKTLSYAKNTYILVNRFYEEFYSAHPSQ